MSLIHFVALTNMEISKTAYKYADILPNIKEGDMFYTDGISFHKELTPSETYAWQHIDDPPSGLSAYAIHSGFKLNYDPDMRCLLSEHDAQNALSEIRWFLSFIKKLLKKNDSVFVISSWLGHYDAKNKIVTQYIDINDFEISEEKPFEFKFGILYQFVDNSPENMERRKKQNCQ